MKQIKTPGNPDLAQRIKAYRVLHGLPLRDFAKDAGVTLTTAWRAEQGKALGVRIAYRLRKFVGAPDA